MTTGDFRERLGRRARRAGVSIPEELLARLETYYRLLTSWNAKINLTALNLSENAPEAIDRVLIEPLVAARYVPLPAGGRALRMLDIGSGGGSPALPLAMALPDTNLVMVESKTRKSVFLREAVRTLELEKAEVVTARVEELLPRADLHEAQDLVTVRAVRIESRLFTTVQAFIRPGGLVFLFRGAGRDLPEAVTPLLEWKATHPLVESLQSRLVVLTKRSALSDVPRETLITGTFDLTSPHATPTVVKARAKDRKRH